MQHQENDEQNGVMDQSTQVNFPIVVRHQMRRHNTSADLFSNNNNNNKSRAGATVNSWNGRMGIVRPRYIKSLSEQCQLGATEVRRKHGAGFYNNNNNHQTNNRLPMPVSDFQLAGGGYTNHGFVSVSRDRTPPPPFSSTASSSMDSICHCHHEHRNYDLSSPEGLSWRRLHMSRAKLKATATTSELLSGFAMIAMVELQINDPSSVPEWLFVMFAVCTTVLVAVHIFALMISTYILPNVDAIAKLDMYEMVAESPHERMRGFIELAWLFSTVLGLFLFLVEVAILCWVKFWDYSFTAATAATVIVIPVLITFVCFAVHFYHSLVVYQCNKSMNEMEKLDDMRKQLDEVTTSSV